MWPIESPPLSHPITTYLTHLSLAISSQRVKDLENREEITKPLRAVKNKRKVYPRKVRLEHSFCVALAVMVVSFVPKAAPKKKGVIRNKAETVVKAKKPVKSNKNS